MTLSSLSSSQRRAIDAMGLGPVWVRRDGGAVPAEADLDAVSSRAARIATLEWDELEAEVASCVACRLCETRTQTVFGVGARRPACLVLGEAPGADEDAQGEPFVGQGGRLLDAMLAAIGFSRTDNVFIANVLKCRPPGNRDPSADEIASCRPFLERQIALLAPRMVLVVGKVASHALLATEASMASLRGREHLLTIGGRDVPVVATYHPAYLLRTPEDKAKAWADLCLARDVHERIAAAG
jgi:uracil-DNA glycosylase family 4